MTKSYCEGEITFMYPENWTVTESNASDRPATISLESPWGGMWSVHIYDESQNANDLLELVSSAYEQNHECLEVETTSEDYYGHHAIGKNIFFYCLDFLVLVKIRVIETSSHTYCFVAQAENRDFEENALAFDAVNVSLLSASGRSQTSAH